MNFASGIWFAFRIIGGVRVLVFDVQGFDCTQSDKHTVRAVPFDRVHSA